MERERVLVRWLAELPAAVTEAFDSPGYGLRDRRPG